MSFTCVFCQKTNEDTKEIIQLIFSDNFELFSKNKYFIRCIQPKTYFNKFNEKLDLKISENVLIELENKSNNQKKVNYWDKSYFKNVLDSKTYVGKVQLECVNVSNEDIVKSRKDYDYYIKDLSYQKGEEFPVIISISNPLFDKQKKHCIISVVSALYTYSFTVTDYFLVKIYGKWVIFQQEPWD